jgi:hypothetical protein
MIDAIYDKSVWLEDQMLAVLDAMGVFEPGTNLAIELPKEARGVGPKSRGRRAHRGSYGRSDPSRTAWSPWRSRSRRTRPVLYHAEMARESGLLQGDEPVQRELLRLIHWRNKQTAEPRRPLRELTRDRQRR